MFLSDNCALLLQQQQQQNTVKYTPLRVREQATMIIRAHVFVCKHDYVVPYCYNHSTNKSQSNTEP